METVTDFDENTLIERIVLGETSLYEKLVRRYNPYLYKIGRSYNYNHEDTQDLMQDTFIDAFKGLVKFKRTASFKTWIVRIMLNNCYKKNKKASYKNEVKQEINESAQPMFNNSSNDTNKKILNRELGHIIEESVLQLPQDYRLVFSLREINGFNVADTANLLQITPSNVKARLSRAKKMIRNKIAHHYSTTDLFDFDLKYCDSMVENVMKIISNE